MINIRCFGISKEIIKTERTQLDLDQISVGQLRILLQSKYVELKNINGFMIAVNQEYADDELIIKSQDEVAIIPPVSGG